MPSTSLLYYTGKEVRWRENRAGKEERGCSSEWKDSSESNIVRWSTKQENTEIEECHRRIKAWVCVAVFLFFFMIWRLQNISVYLQGSSTPSAGLVFTRCDCMALPWGAGCICLFTLGWEGEWTGWGADTRGLIRKGLLFFFFFFFFF